MNWITRDRRKIDRIACPWLMVRETAERNTCLAAADYSLGS